MAAGGRSSSGWGPRTSADAGNIEAQEQAPLPEERLAFALSDGRVGVLGVRGRHVSLRPRLRLGPRDPLLRAALAPGPPLMQLLCLGPARSWSPAARNRRIGPVTGCHSAGHSQRRSVLSATSSRKYPRTVRHCKRASTATAASHSENESACPDLHNQHQIDCFSQGQGQGQGRGQGQGQGQGRGYARARLCDSERNA